MPSIPTRVAERLAASIRRFQPVLASARDRDVNESDTVIIVTDMLAEVFGYDKYTEITSECAIRSTYCDLGIKIDGKFLFLIEVKAIGLELKELHMKQAVDYAANQGTDWVVLANGECWRVYRIGFGKPITSELVLTIEFSRLNPKKTADLELLYHLTREGWAKSAIEEFHNQRQALSRYALGALVLSQPVLDVIRREVRRLSPDVRIETEQIKEALMLDVLKRDVIEGEKADEAARKIARAANRLLRARPSSATPDAADISDAAGRDDQGGEREHV
jgi:predicted type IV restriction endonuclease